MRKLLHSQRNGEKVESIPAPASKGDEEEHPLLNIEQSEKLEWIRRFSHRRLESCEPSGDVGTD